MASRKFAAPSIGTRFGKGVVTESEIRVYKAYAHPGGRRGSRLVCDCGNTYEADHVQLRGKTTVSCGHCVRPPDLGERFGYGVIITSEIRANITPNRPGGERGSELLCDCGKIYEATLYQLRNKSVQSCGDWTHQKRYKGPWSCRYCQCTDINYAIENKPTKSFTWAFCKRCTQVRAHNVPWDIYAQWLEKGCAICGSNVLLGIDHDHKCCPGNRSCGKCARGLLCNDHNFLVGGIERGLLPGTLEYISEWERLREKGSNLAELCQDERIAREMLGGK